MANAGGNNGQFPAKLPVFDGKNYDRWILQMQVIFRYQDVIDIVRDGVTATAGDLLREQRKKDSKALFLIHQCVDVEVFERIAQFEMAKQAWDALAAAYSGDAKLKRVKLQTLRRQYELLQMEEQDSVAEYINRLTLVTNQMRTNGETITEQLKVEKVLRTLTPKFDSLVNAIEQSKDLETMKLAELQGSLEAQEVRIKERNPVKGTESALQAQFTKKEGLKKKGKGKWKNKGEKGDAENSNQQNTNENN